MHIAPPALPDEFIRLAHRGGPKQEEQENRIRTFEDALTRGANGIEYDLRRAMPQGEEKGPIAVHHDETMQRTSHVPGLLSDYTADNLFLLRIPLFAHVLQEIGPRAMHNIELKEAGLSEEVVKLIMRYHMKDHVFVSAFDRRDDESGRDGTATWEDLAIFPPHDIPIALLAGKDKIRRMGEQGFVDEAIKRNASAINPPFASVTQALVDRAHEKGLKVYPWTVNKPEDIMHMLVLGVDGIFSDYVERLPQEVPHRTYEELLPQSGIAS